MTFFLEEAISSQVIALCKSLMENSATPIGMGMSLTQDLGFDSIKLMQFFAGIEDTHPGVALEDWFLEHSYGGRDTIGSVVLHLARILAPVAAE
jgi:hypothetical protein